MLCDIIINPISYNARNYKKNRHQIEWKTEFRVLDMSRNIFIEKDEAGEVWICAKFPFALKEVFDKEILPIIKDFGTSTWDTERKIRRMKFYNFK